MRKQSRKRPNTGDLLARCLRAFIEAGTLDLSLDQLAKRAGISKRMLVHYFGSRETIENAAMAQLEDMLRAQFAPQFFPARSSSETVLTALWERTTKPESKNVLRLVMDVSRRAWNGSQRARDFYDEQLRLWARLLLRFVKEPAAVEEVLQLFQGAVLRYLITGDPEPGQRALMRVLARRKTRPTPAKRQARH
jgi:AcrR family transcriptional regulator